MTYNPSLREEPRDQKASVISTPRESSILDWLESTGRLQARDHNEFDSYSDDEEELSELVGSDDSFDLDDDDDLDLED